MNISLYFSSFFFGGVDDLDASPEVREADRDLRAPLLNSLIASLLPLACSFLMLPFLLYVVFVQILPH